MKKLVTKGLADALRFTTNETMRQACFKALNVGNSADAEKVIYRQLTDMKPIVIPESLPEEEELPETKKIKVICACVVLAPS